MQINRVGTSAGMLAIILALQAACSRLPSKIEPPSVSLADIRIVEMNLIEQTFAIRLRVQNPNAFEIPVHGLNYRIDFNGQEVAHGVSSQSVTFPALGEEFIEVQAVTSLNSILQQLAQVAREGTASVDYRVRGSFRAGSGLGSFIPLPFDQQGRLGLNGLLDCAPRKPGCLPEYL